MNNINKVIELSSKVKNRAFILPGFFLVGIIVGLMILRTLMMMFVVFGILSLIIAFLNQNIKVFTFYDKHFVYQPGIAIKKMVLYNSIDSYEVFKRKLVIKYKDGGKVKKIQLLKEAIEKEDLAYLENFLKEHIKK